MFLKNLEIREGAIFIADAHDGEVRKNFLIFLKKLEKGEIETSQLFLMGDMFDLLVPLEYLLNLYHEYIKLINRLSKKIEIIYFEGNHDFLLKEIFPNVKVFSIKEQPVNFIYKENIKFLLSHGDKDENIKYKIYTTLVRSKVTAFIVASIDKLTKYSFSKKILLIQNSKKICKKMRNFKEKIEKKVLKYSSYDYIIEGHFHQGEVFIFSKMIYFNIPSLACGKNYTMFKKGYFLIKNFI